MPDQSVGTPISSFGSTSQVPMGGTRLDQFFVDALINLFFSDLSQGRSPEETTKISSEIFATVINSRLQAHRDLSDQKTALRQRLGFAVATYVTPCFPPNQFLNDFDVMKKLDEMNEALQVEIKVLSNMLSRTHHVASSDDSELSRSVSPSGETLRPSPQEEDSEQSLSRQGSVETLIGSAPMTPLDPNRPNGGRLFQPTKRMGFCDVGTTTRFDLHPV
jgi:hypothetical protein